MTEVKVIMRTIRTREGIRYEASGWSAFIPFTLKRGNHKEFVRAAREQEARCSRRQEVKP